MDVQDNWDGRIEWGQGRKSGERKGMWRETTKTKEPFLGYYGKIIQ